MNERDTLDRLIRYFTENNYIVEEEIPTKKGLQPDLIIKKNESVYIIEVQSRIFSTSQLFSIISYLLMSKSTYNADGVILVTTTNIGEAFLNMLQRMGIGYIFANRDIVQEVLKPRIVQGLDELKDTYKELKIRIEKKISGNEYQINFLPLIYNLDQKLDDFSLLHMKYESRVRSHDQDIISDILIDKLREMDDFLYREEIDEFIKNQKSQSYNLFDITLKTLEKLWKKHKKSEAYQMFENFQEYEKILFKDAPYRDHFIHQFQVFLIGLPIIEKKINEILKFFKKSLDGNFDKDKIYFTWLLTSTFHDIGYPVQQFPYWIRIFFKEYIDLDIQPATINFSKILSQKNFLEYIDKICSLFNHISKSKNEKWIYTKNYEIDNKFRNFIIDKLLEERNHGVISALCLMDKIEYGKYAKDHPNYKTEAFSSNVSPAGLAIMLHDLEIYSNKLVKEINFLSNPLTFLLIYCDTVQEWGRPGKWAESNRLDPILSDFSIESNKISTTLTYQRNEYFTDLDSNKKIYFYNRKCKELKLVFNNIKNKKPIFEIKLINNKTRATFSKDSG